MQASDVFSEDVELEVDDGAYTDVAEIGVLKYHRGTVPPVSGPPVSAL